MSSGIVTTEQSLLLCREASLASSSIGQGLTMLRKSNFIEDGYTYQAFFMLSIGMERLLKLIVIYDYRARENNRFPGNGYLKQQGHNILSLYQKAINIADGLGENQLYQSLTADPIYDAIMNCLTEFAFTARYYNLDKLTGHPNRAQEPISNWDSAINSLIVNRHYKENPKRSTEEQVLLEKAGDLVLVILKNEQGQPITSMGDLLKEDRTTKIKQVYSMFYTYCIVRFLSRLLHKMDGQLMPLVSEYFNMFRMSDDAYIRRQKQWKY